MVKRLLFLFLLAMPCWAQKCGVERWPVKTLADSEGPQVMGLTPIAGEISALVKIKPPSRTYLQKATADRFPSEKKQYKLDALVLGFKREADSDFHIVLADPKNPSITMIAEIPAGACVADKDYQAYFGTLQQHFEKQFGQPTAKYNKLKQPVHVTVTGVFFFDFLHGQTGVAPNGAELHPVLGIDILKN